VGPPLQCPADVAKRLCGDHSGGRLGCDAVSLGGY
jgi:hypothetical protein